MVKKRPDTEPPEEERPETTTTPLLVEKGKLLPKAVMFTAETLLRWLEDLAVQHGKKKLGENALRMPGNTHKPWSLKITMPRMSCSLSLAITDDYVLGRNQMNVLQSHVEIITLYHTSSVITDRNGALVDHMSGD